MKLTKGTILKARGGWDAEVVHVVMEDPNDRHRREDAERKDIPVLSLDSSRGHFYAVHRHGKNVSDPVCHDYKGVAKSSFSTFKLPAYNGHPADLEMGEYEL